MLCVVMDSNHNKNVKIGNKSPPPPPSGSNLYEAFVLKNPLIYELLLKRISDLAKKKALFSIATIFLRECFTRFSLALKSNTYEENIAEYIPLRLGKIYS